jgi:hypothetical protein
MYFPKKNNKSLELSYREPRNQRLVSKCKLIKKLPLEGYERESEMILGSFLLEYKVIVRL